MTNTTSTNTQNTENNPQPPFKSLLDHFLIAMPQLNDTFFANSIVYICGHSPDGAIGVMINKPSPLRMTQLFESIDKETPKRFEDTWVLFGGPVQGDHGFLVHSPIGNWQNSVAINDDVAITLSKDILLDLSKEKNSHIKSFATIGYTAWSANQLEKEIEDGRWLITPSDKKILFDMPFYGRYEAALKKLGIRMENLSKDIGHA